ncbi:MAG TPA: GNAT family N-acetyltransferase [Nocardioidaceae bacterium]|nr:GNAT family N-acetyltransferase [Nocardioidaceae bacterium]
MITIRRLNPYDDAEFAAFHAAYNAADSFERPHAATWSIEELVIPLRRKGVDSDHYGLIAQDGDDVVGVAMLELPLTDNLELADVGVWVPPKHRRRGIGTALARQIAVDLRQRGRTKWICMVAGPPYDQPDDTSMPGEAFAARFGLTLRQREVQRRMSLPAPVERLDALARDAASHHGDYRLERWIDACPEEYVEAYCALKSAMVDEMPRDDLDIESEKWDAERLRDFEAAYMAQDRTRYVYVAVAPDGSIVAHTELLVPTHDPELIYQWDTLVLPGHRGHRLGMALKVANLAWVQAEHPERKVVRTWNAATNGPMIAVNEAMGFVPVEYEGTWQGDVPRE